MAHPDQPVTVADRDFDAAHHEAHAINWIGDIFDNRVPPPTAAELLAESEAATPSRKRKRSRESTSAPPPSPPPSTTIGEGEDARPPEYSDDALALRHANTYSDSQRYVSAWGRWLSSDGTVWRNDDTLFTFDCARKTCRQAAHECIELEMPRQAGIVASAKTVAAVERLARADRRIAATTLQWDADGWALNTPKGMVDLRSGEMHPHRLLDYATKITTVAPDHGCKTPHWQSFLKTVTAGDQALIEFLQRMVGYALTGSTQEHSLFFLYGKGANGKSTFINAITGCVGNYHRTAPIETFTASKTERHPTELAGLRGARLVTAVETEEGRRWAESRIKALTGGDVIAARFMRQDFFEFLPIFKLIIAGNHKPGLRSVDEAIRRRVKLVPFTITIPPADRDETLSDKLKAEWPGILAWAIDGCLDWQERGLAPPSVVDAATAAYFEAEDSFVAWFEDCCVAEAGGFENTRALFESWKGWANRSGEYAGAERKFAQKLDDRADQLGLHRTRDGAGRRGFRGLRLIASNMSDNGAAASVEPADVNDLEF